MKNRADATPLLTALLKGGNTNYINATERTSVHYDIFLDSEITEPSDYRDLISILFNATEEDTIHVFINSPGGALDTAIAIIEGLKACNAKTTGIVVGACHSAASIIMMYFDEVAILDGANSMVHTASFGTQGNTSNVRSYTDFTVKQVEQLLNKTYEGFLSPEELKSVKTGVELWFDAEEIRDRMAKRNKMMASRAKKAAKKIAESEE